MERGQGLDHPENTDWTGNGKNYFFGIGIDRYHHWEPLSNAVKDVNDFITVLTTQYQFEPDEIHTLYDGDATESRIYQKIRELKRMIGAGDNLVIYYSGHGHYDEDFEEGYWIPVDAEKGSEDRFISNANIIKRVNALGTHHTLLIVDSCFSGSLVVKKRSGLTDERFRSRRILASGRQETVADGRPGDNSPFAAGILTYLKKNTEKAINTTALVQYVKDYVQTQARQTPVEGRIQNSADEGGEFVFHLKVDEQSLWESVQQKDAAEAYANYLDYYPNGLFANQANRRILELKEEDIWRSAKIKDSELAYENYLKKYYPGGKYIGEANERLEKLQARQKERREALDEIAKKDEERDQIRKKYNGLIGEAESLFGSKELLQAREKYRDALRYHMPGFVPNTEYVEEQISFCSNGITFLNHYENGRQAMDQRNYRLALQYFGEALKLDDNPKVEDLISYCRLKLEESTRRPEPVVSKSVHVQKTVPQRAYQPAPAKKKSSFRVPIIVGAVFILLVIIAFAINGIGTDDPYLDTDDTYQSYQNIDDQDPGTVPVQEPEYRPETPAPTYAEMIIGSWQLTNFYSQDQAANTMLQMMNGMQATYTFYANGQVNASSNFGVANFPYHLNGSQISIPGDIQRGTIDQLDDQKLVLTAYYNQNGYEFSITFVFRKMG